ncbi:hypothetical protein [Halobacteriovorax sp. JY17]|uniref:hypothetical protein n=1 Tax=Halobacteriovorax sp. JY17 TaxID=2014617 RepID=UPI000C510309|nr:hypothetical protein [Halobacteriovorax sp. JY17]PIK14656.1 MAG: hypothetical protein CES88_09970 [Halobacteriovorax sp. JY17]
MNRKEFLSLLLLSAVAPKSVANYDSKDQGPKSKSPSKEMNYILFNLYESPPRWLFDLPLRPLDNSHFKPSPMIGTEFIDGKVIYKTIKFHNFNMPSFLENKIPTASEASVKISEVFQNALIIRGCNMNKDGHDTNSKILESSSEGKISFGGKISELSKRPR